MTKSPYQSMYVSSRRFIFFLFFIVMGFTQHCQSFILSGIGVVHTIPTPLVKRLNNEIYMVKRIDIEETENSFENLPKLKEGVLEQLERVVDKFVASSTISTTSYYMTEFKNDIGKCFTS